MQCASHPLGGNIGLKGEFDIVLVLVAESSSVYAVWLVTSVPVCWKRSDINKAETLTEQVALLNITHGTTF